MARNRRREIIRLNKGRQNFYTATNAELAQHTPAVFQFAMMFGVGEPSTDDDPFAEPTSAGGVSVMTSFPVPASSPKSAAAAESEELSARSRVSRALTFDNAGSRRPRGGPPASAVARRRCSRGQPPVDPPVRASAAPEYHDGAEPSQHDVAALVPGCVEDEDRADLIGDMSGEHVLPLEHNLQHVDLKSISPHTVSYYLFPPQLQALCDAAIRALSVPWRSCSRL